MRLEDLSIARTEDRRISDLHRVGISGGKRAEKTIQGIKEACRFHTGPLKLKNEGPDAFGKRLDKGLQHQVAKCVAIEKMGIGLPGFGPIAGQIGGGGNGEFLPHLRAKLKVGGNLAAEVRELRCARRTIERMVDADGAEQRRPVYMICRIFSEAVFGKAVCRIGSLIDLFGPTFVGPGTGAESYEPSIAHQRYQRNGLSTSLTARMHATRMECSCS